MREVSYPLSSDKLAWASYPSVCKKMCHSLCLISPATSSLESWDISQMKCDIHGYILSTISFLWDIEEPR